MLATGALAAVGLVVVAGCADTTTAYRRPFVEVPAAWQQAGGQRPADPPDATPGAAWWREFGDERLSRLVEAALASNADLAAAASRLRQADLRAQLAAGALRPTPSAAVSVSQSRSDFGTSRSSGASASVSYEVDLWGRLASARDAAQWEAAATDEDRRSLAVTIAANAVGLYWQIGYLDERLASSGASLAYAERTRALVRVQYAAGALSSLELRQADQAVAGQLATLSALRQQRFEARTTLALLFDLPPESALLDDLLPAEPRLPSNEDLPRARAGLPASMLGRRPDLRAAELRLRETLAQGDATRAAYYPSLTLTGSLGTASAELARVLANPVATLGAGIALPFLRIDDYRLDSALAREQFAQSSIDFRRLLYRALGDVEVALSSTRRLAEQSTQLQLQLDAARDVERLYEVRYRAGAATLQLWLDAQERRRAAEVSLLLNRLDRANAQVTLFKALGGGTA